MIGVILLNMGGPDSLSSVKPFLQNLFSDRDIIKLGPSFLQRPIASMIIKMKLKKSLAAYKLIGGKSPLPDITHQQARALEEALNKQSEAKGLDVGSHNEQFKDSVSSAQTFKVFVAMRYWHPFTMETVNQICREGIKEIIAVSLYPQYSKATSGSSIKNLAETFANISKTDIEVPKTYKKSFTIDYSLFKVHFVASWYDHPLYIDSVVDKIKKGFELFRTGLNVRNPELEVPVLFSAHSLPQKFIDHGDPYAEETKGTINEILKKININWHLSYQSKAGPVKWLEPSTEDKITQLAKRDVKNLLVVPISFVSDHIETLYEIDMLYKDMAKKLGMNLQRTESLNTSPMFIKALKDIVNRNI